MGTETKKTICKKCKHRELGNGAHTQQIECKSPAAKRMHGKLNYVTGKVSIPRCIDINGKGQCQLYEEKRRWWKWDGWKLK